MPKTLPCLVGRAHQVKRDHSPRPLFLRTVRPERPVCRVPRLAPARDGINVARRARLIVCPQVEEVRAVIVIVVQTAPQSSQALLPVQQVLGDALALRGCPFDGS